MLEFGALVVFGVSRNLHPLFVPTTCSFFPMQFIGCFSAAIHARPNLKQQRSLSTSVQGMRLSMNLGTGAAFGHEKKGPPMSSPALVYSIKHIYIYIIQLDPFLLIQHPTSKQALMFSSLSVMCSAGPPSQDPLGNILRNFAGQGGQGAARAFVKHHVDPKDGPKRRNMNANVNTRFCVVTIPPPLFHRNFGSGVTSYFASSERSLHL